jgi:hypothetical protein
VGFGYIGMTHNGSGNVPVTGESWNWIFEGARRVFTPVPDLIVTNLGTNDGTANIVPQMTGLLNNLLASCTGARIAVLRPFNGAQAANLQAAIAGCADPAAVTYVDTTGFYDPTYGGSLHPAGPNDVDLVAPAVATALQPLLMHRR